MSSILWAADPPKEVVGFGGKLTGTVQTNDQDEGDEVVVLVATAEPAPASEVKDGSALVGKQVPVTARWKNGNEKDQKTVDYLKSLQVGDKVAVSVFWEKEANRLRLYIPEMAVAQSKEAAGFGGELTGTVQKNDPEEGDQVVILVTNASPSPASEVKDGTTLVGQPVVVTARWKTGNEKDQKTVDYLKSLQVGDNVTVTVFWEKEVKKLRLYIPE
jgi:hypothetical protein